MKKKKILILLMTLVACLFALAVTANADEGEHKHSGVTAAYEPFPTSATSLGEGYYYLTEDCTIEQLLSTVKNAEVEICLNGHTLKSTSGEVLSVNLESELTITDCTTDGEGSIEAGNQNEYIITIAEEDDDEDADAGELYIKNCSLSGYYGINNEDGGYVNVNQITSKTTGDFLRQLYSGSSYIKNSTIQCDNDTGIYTKSYVYLYNTDLTAKKYGIDVIGCTVQIYGGSISGETADVYLSGSNAKLDLHGKIQGLNKIYLTGGTICANASGTQPFTGTETVVVSIPEGKIADALIGTAIITDAQEGQFVLENSTDERKLVYDAETKSYVFEARLSDIASGTVSGTGLKWVLDGYGTLTISGSGAIPDKTDNSTLPWDKYSQEIKAIVIGDGCTGIGNYVFCNGNMSGKNAYGYLESIRFENSTTLTIGNYAFQNCTALKSIEFAGTGDIIPGEYVFQWCDALTTVHIPKTVKMNGSYSGIGSGEAMFSGCSGLKTATVDCAYVGPFMFEGNNIQQITFTNPNVKFYWLENNHSGHPINSYSAVVTLVGYTCSEVQKLVNESTSWGYKLKFEAIEGDTGSHKNIVELPAVAATCTTDGKTAGQKCTNCGTVLVAQEVVAATGHTAAEAVRENETPATCIAEGSYEEVVYCAYCHTEMSRVTKTAEKTGHTEVIDAAVEPTCTETGLTEGKHCSVCNTVLVAQTVVSAKGHTAGESVRENEVAATCKAAGSYDEVVYCTVCGTEMSRTAKTIEKLAHTAGEAVRENEVAATCKAEGSYDEVIYCTACGTELSRTTKTIEKLAHTPGESVRENEVAATCEAEGSYDEVVYCAVCGTEMSRTTKTLEKLAHTEGTSVRENEVAATCKAEGSYDEVVYCTACGTEMSRETKTIEKLEHTAGTPVRENEVAATCKAEGSYDEVVYCAVCGTEMSRTDKVIEKLAHTAGEAVRENEVAATCTTAGSYDEVIYCTVCGTEMSRTTKTIEKLAHTEGTPVRENEVAATCTTAGSYDEVIYCTVCGTEMSRIAKVIEKLAHTEGTPVRENEVAATCTAEGSYDEVVYCTACGTEMSRTAKVIEKLAHTAGEPVRENEVAATCKAEGSYDEVVYCAVCGTEMSRTTKTLEKLAHTEGTPVRENEVAATCTTAGSYDEVVYCAVCGTEMSRTTKTIEKLAHTAGEAVRENEVAATCKAAGSYDEVIYCTACGTELSRTTKTLEKLAHTAGEAVRENEVAATCTTAGSYDEVIYCTVCGTEMSRTTKTIEKLAHTEGTPVRENEVAATCKAAGSYDEVIYCTVCGTEMSRTTKTLEKLAHTEGEPVRENEVAATCTATGSYDEVVYCAVCGTEMSRETKTIEKLEHTAGEPVRENEVAATCKAEGSFDEVIYCTACGTELSRTAKVIEKLAHTPGEPVRENEVAATCEAEGSYDEVVYCAVCGTEMSRTTKTLEKLAHTEGEPVRENEVAATCKAAGSYDEVVYCTVCSTEMSRTAKVIEKLAHTAGAAVIENSKPATCTENGTYDTVTYCAKCNTEMTRETTVVPALGHSFSAGNRYCDRGCGTRNPNYSQNPVQPEPTPVTPVQPETPENPFRDVTERDWYYDDVRYVEQEGLMLGTTATTFGPNLSTTRGMIVTILYRLEGSPAVTQGNPFLDVKAGSYYEKAIIWAAANDIVAGYGDGNFGPDDNITREQLAAILYRYAQYKGMDVSVGKDTNIMDYEDVASISSYAVPAIQWACGESLMQGSGWYFGPKNEATRAQVAAVLHRFCVNLKK